VEMNFNKTGWIIALLIMIPIVLAISVSIKWSADTNNFNGEVWHCTDSECNNVDNNVLSGLSSGTSNIITTDFQAASDQVDYHAAYFTKSCYIPNAFIITTTGPGNYSESQYMNFNKKNFCISLIDSVNDLPITSTSYFNNLGTVFVVGQPAVLNVNVKSPFSSSDADDGTPGYIPDGLKDEHYSALTMVCILLFLVIING